jgi:hypothetical protein
MKCVSVDNIYLFGSLSHCTDPVWGDALAAFDNKEEGKKACRALGALAAVGQIDTTINNFLVPLQVING